MRVVQPWIRSQSWAPALAGAPGGKELCWGATWGKNLPGPAALSPLSLPVLGFACWCLLLLWLEQLLGWIGAWASASSSIPRDLGVAAALGQGEGARPCLTVEEHQISPYGCGNPGSYCPAAAWAGSGHAPPSVPLASPPSAPPGGLSDVASSLAKPPSRSDQCLRCAPRRLLPLPARGSLCAAAAATRGRRTGSCFPALAEMLRCPGRTGREQSLRGERPTARIACSMPFGVLCYCMMWSTLADGAPVSLKFLWYLFTYNFFQICMTCYHVPYSSLTMFLGGTQRDRDSATAYRMGMEVFSTLLGSGIQGQMVGAYHGRMTNGCSFGNGTLPNSSTPGLAGSLEGTSLRVCLPGPGLDLLPLLSDSRLRGQGAAGAPQPPGEGWAAFHELPEDDRGTQALHPAALWLPLRVPGLPGHAGDFCFLLYSRRGAGREVPALGAHHAGHSFPLYPLLAVVFGEIWEEDGSDLGPGADHPGPGGHHPGEPQLPGLRPPDGGGRLQLGRALPPALFCRLPHRRLHVQPHRRPRPEASHGPGPNHPAAHRHNHLLPPSHQRGAEEADEDGAGGDGASGAAWQLRPPPGLNRCEGCFLRVPESMVGCWNVLPSATTLLSASLPAD
ncbi:uncharacterized protein [Anser cygnoides]|uniref:uncharacterized protein isoform X4 n=1 Tax=Anser cygnoides TaxID=8845 RepID=UPI0034D28FC2